MRRPARDRVRVVGCTDARSNAHESPSVGRSEFMCPVPWEYGMTGFAKCWERGLEITVDGTDPSCEYSRSLPFSIRFESGIMFEMTRLPVVGRIGLEDETGDIGGKTDVFFIRTALGGFSSSSKPSKFIINAKIWNKCFKLKWKGSFFCFEPGEAGCIFFFASLAQNFFCAFRDSIPACEFPACGTFSRAEFGRQIRLMKFFSWVSRHFSNWLSAWGWYLERMISPSLFLKTDRDTNWSSPVIEKCSLAKWVPGKSFVL